MIGPTGYYIYNKFNGLIIKQRVVIFNVLSHWGNYNKLITNIKHLYVLKKNYNYLYLIGRCLNLKYKQLFYPLNVFTQHLHAIQISKISASNHIVFSCLQKPILIL